MTILTAGACAFIATSTGHAIPAAVGTAAGAVVTGVKIWFQSEPVKVALSTAVGTGTSSGAIAGAVASKTALGALTGAFVGGITSASVGSVLAGSMAMTSEAIASSPFGLLAVGMSHSRDGNQITYDCWKPVVHDMSEDFSGGMLLKDLVCHPHIADITVTPSEFLPQIVLKNIWKEKFEIEYVVLQDTNKLVCHASPIYS